MPFRRYRWRILPFGLSLSPEIFQEKLDHAMEVLKGAFTVFDDILVIGEGETEKEAEKNHDEQFQ